MRSNARATSRTSLGLVVALGLGTGLVAGPKVSAQAEGASVDVPAEAESPLALVASSDTEASVSASPDAAASVGTRLVGDACDASSECGDGLVCETGICTPEEGRFVEPTSLPRFFFQLGYGVGAAYASADMRADSTVPYDPAHKPATWNETVNGPYAPPGYTEAQWANVLQALYGGYVAPSGGAGGVIAQDSSCDVDADEYCVRVRSPGFAPTGGLRFSLGYFFTERIGASMEWRFQTHAGQGSMGRVMASARVHFRLTEPSLEGLDIDAFAGFGFGQLQLRVDQGRYRGPDLCEVGSVGVGQRCDDPAANATPSIAYLREGTEAKRPWIQTGPYSVQLGANVGYHVNRSFALVLRPTLLALFPEFTFGFELGLGGEVTF